MTERNKYVDDREDENIQVGLGNYFRARQIAEANSEVEELLKELTPSPLPQNKTQKPAPPPDNSKSA